MRNLNLTGIITGTAIALSILISLPIEAQTNRRSATRTEQRNESRANSRSNQGRRPSSNNQSNINRNNNKKQPNINKKPNNQRPNDNHGRPSDKKHNQGYQKPNKGNYWGNHKQQPHPQPHHSHHYNHHPKWNAYMAPPARPYRPKYRPIPHIAPPPHWRPNHNAPIINGILGLTFGTIYNATLDYLYSQNFTIDGYTDDIIYLRNVPQYNYNWDDVMLNYVSGRLANAQFVYSSRHYDTNRYNSVYLTLRNTYGSPISMRTITGGGYECMWYGGNSQGMVTLEFYPESGRYYTTLSFGSSY